MDHATGQRNLELRQTARNCIVARHRVCVLAIAGEGRLPCPMERSMHGRTPNNFIAAEAGSPLSRQASRATFEAQTLIQRGRNASAIVRAYQKVARERHEPVQQPR
jgi:hypothetical protein